MRLKVDPSPEIYRYRGGARAALAEAMRKNRRSTWRGLIVATGVGVAVALAFVSINLPAVAAGFLTLVGLLSVIAALAAINELGTLSERHRGPWEAARIQERYVWKTTEVRNNDNEVTENFLYLIPHSLGPGERVADPHAIGKEKYVTGPGVLVPEVLSIGGIDRMAYLGRTILLATSRDGLATVMMLVPDGDVMRIKGLPVPAVPPPPPAHWR